MEKVRVILLLALALGRFGDDLPDVRAQCSMNTLINPGFETVGPPCGMVPPNGLINGAFNQGCMTGWESAWGTPSVCADFPFAGNYFACLGANNEGFFQNLQLYPDSSYCLSFYYRRLNSGAGNLDVYLASGLVNQPMSNSGVPPLPVQPTWQLLGSFPSTGNAWVQAIIPSFMQEDPANHQLLFLDVPVAGLDVGIDDVFLTIPDTPRTEADLDIECISQAGGTFTFLGTMDPVPPGWSGAQWFWEFGDGGSDYGQSVTHVYGAYGVYEVCLTIFLTCGCEYAYCESFEYGPCTCGCGMDSDPPEIVSFDPGPIEVFCLDDIPLPEPPVITDCDPSPSLLFSESSTGTLCDRTILYHWIASDPCGNTAMVTQTIVMLDNTPPVFDVLPSGLTVQCPDQVDEFLLWVSDFGGAETTDDCGPVVLSTQYDSLPSGSCGEVPVLFIATDECGNVSSAQAIYTYTDPFPPEVLVLPSNLVFPCLEPDTSEVNSWLASNGGTIITENCGGTTWSNDFSGDLSMDSVLVTFTAEDECFNRVSVSAWILQPGESDTLLLTDFTCDPLLAGLDSVWQTNGVCTLLTVTEWVLLPSDTLRDTLITCDPAEAGIDSVLLVNQFMCDSLVLITTRYIPSDTTRVSAHTCDSLMAGQDTVWLLNAAGCDSLVITVTSFTGGQIEILEEVRMCAAGVPYSDTVVVEALPCDTVKITHYIFSAPDTTYLADITCNPGSAGTDTTVWTDALGCDSTVIITFSYMPADTTVTYEYTCFGPDTLGEALLFINQYGCDSLLWVYFWINVAPDTQYVQRVTCDSALAGTVILHVPGPMCDTVRVVETALSPSLILLDSIAACGPAGTYQDTVFLMTQEGCDSLIVHHYTYASPEAEVTVTDETCAGAADGGITVTNISGGEPPYQYMLNHQPVQSDPYWISLPPGPYTVVVSDASGCTDTVQGIVIQDGLEFSIDGGSDLTVEEGDFVDLDLVSGLTPVEVQWQATDPIECPVCPSTRLGPVTISQLVQVSAITETGCLDEDEFRITVKPEDPVYVPNVFSPNGDGVNDRFRPLKGQTSAGTFKMNIFDRWGNLLFSDAEMVWGPEQEGWDGTFHGKQVLPGVYAYVIEFMDEYGQKRRFAGDLTLIR